MRSLALLFLLLATCASAGSKQRVALIDGVALVVQKPIASSDFIALKGLKVYDAIRNDTGEDCSIILGQVITQLPDRQYDVTITIELHRLHVSTGYIHNKGTATATIKQARKGVPITFKAIGQAVIAPDWNEELPSDRALHYTTSFRIRKHVPTPPPAAPDGR